MPTFCLAKIAAKWVRQVMKLTDKDFAVHGAEKAKGYKKGFTRRLNES